MFFQVSSPKPYEMKNLSGGGGGEEVTEWVIEPDSNPDNVNREALSTYGL